MGAAAGSWTLVTDEDVHPEAVAPFVAAGVDVVIVDSGGRAEKA